MSKKVETRKLQAVKKFIGDNQVACVTGAFFGDEAKGKMVDELSKVSDAIARVNSGENAGHTVYYKNKKYVFHLIPSAVMTGKKTFIGDNCVMDPINFMKEEVSLLTKDKISYKNLQIGNVFIVHALHKLVDIMRDPNASTGKGMSAVHQDIVGKRAIRLEDFLNKDHKQLEKSINFWWEYLVSKGLNKKEIRDAILANKKVPPHIKNCLKYKTTSAVQKYLISSITRTIRNKSFPKTTNVQSQMTKLVKTGKKVLLEGSQSFFLANTEGTHYSSTTSANTTASGVYASSNMPLHFSVATLNVTKVPSSRVGSGANPGGYVEQDWFSKRGLTGNDLKKLKINFEHSYNSFVDSIDRKGFQNEVIYLNENNAPILVQGKKITVNEALAISSCIQYAEFGATTGKPRVCGTLDLLHLAQTIKYQDKYLSISCIDRLDNLNKVLVIVKYIYEGATKISNGKIYKKGMTISTKNDLPREVILQNCRPIYKKLSGWKTSQAVNGKSLDKNLSTFLEFIEKQAACEIISFGNGPMTNDLIYLK
jgi:adenylosuccinate synthase